MAAAAARIDRLEPPAAYAALRDGALLVDIRADVDRERKGIVPGSLHVPRTVLEWRFEPGGASRNPYACGLDDRLILLCNQGYSTVLAAATLSDLGYRQVADVIGGFQSWIAHGLPTIPAPSASLAPGELAGMRPPDGKLTSRS
jgi:rhodanese-related sulfurtransferase